MRDQSVNMELTQPNTASQIIHFIRLHSGRKCVARQRYLVEDPARPRSIIWMRHFGALNDLPVGLSPTNLGKVWSIH
jgi:hypothetical protein